MALISSYLVSTKNVKPLLDSLLTAKAPDAFTQKFIEGLGFKSTNDRLFIGLLKGLGFLDPNAAPTERYFRFLDQSQSKKVLAEAVEEAYGDLFAVHTKAYELPVAEVKNKLKTLTQGKFSDNVVGLMGTTFKALSEYADWKTSSSAPTKPKEKPAAQQQDTQSPPPVFIPKPNQTETEEEEKTGDAAQFHYNIQIHLPESRDESIYDAIFKSLRKHLL